MAFAPQPRSDPEPGEPDPACRGIGKDVCRLDVFVNQAALMQVAERGCQPDRQRQKHSWAHGCADQILERAEKAVDHGANMVMVDVLTAGFSALEVLSRNVKVPVHVHRTMHGALTRDKGHGISMVVIAKLVRMAGGTNLHTGSYLGKMAREIEENDLCRDALRNEWHGRKRVFPVASGGIYPATVHANLDGYGVDCIVQAGGGVHGHPGGTTAGARAMVQAAEAWMNRVPLSEYAKDHEELNTALKFWRS